MSKKRPRVKVRCPADRYHAPGERIVEFGHGDKGEGGLISFQTTQEGKLMVTLFRLNGDITMSVGGQAFIHAPEPSPAPITVVRGCS